MPDIKKVSILDCCATEEPLESESELDDEDNAATVTDQPQIFKDKTFDPFEMDQALARPEDAPSPMSPRSSPSLTMPASVGSTAKPQMMQALQNTQPTTVSALTAAVPTVGMQMQGMQIQHCMPPGATFFIMGSAGQPAMMHPSFMQSAMMHPQMMQTAMMASGPQAMPMAYPVALGVVSGATAGFVASAPAAAVTKEPQQPQTVLHEVGADGRVRIKWTVDARKLKANDKVVISPSFTIHALPGTFRMIINPSTTKFRGGTTFRNSNGRGNVQLKCETDSQAMVRFRFLLGDGRQDGRQLPSRGDVEHNFSLGGVCGLPKQQEEWDFNRVVDESSKTFVVCIEVLQ